MFPHVWRPESWMKRTQKTFPLEVKCKQANDEMEEKENQERHEG